MRLTASVVSITIDGFKLADSIRGFPIQGPHWQAGHPERYRAAAVEIGRNTRIDVEIEVSEAEEVPPDLWLDGSMGTIRVYHEMPLSLRAGSNHVRALLRGADRGFQHHAGRLAWSLRTPGGHTLDLGRTPVEIFELFAEPPELYSKCHGVPVELLRFLAGPVGLVGTPSRNLAVAAVTTYCHSGHGLRYAGKSFFMDPRCDGTFALSDFLERAQVTANCYDQAAAVQALAGAVGADVRYRLIDKFGFLTVQNLVGIGPTNNPGFDAIDQPRFIRNGQPGRFDNHGFCEHEEGVFDACLGPFLGDLSPGEYLAAVIDFGIPDPNRADEDDIVACPGVTEVI